MGSSRWDVVVGLKYSKWSLANQTSVVLFLDCRQFCMEKNIWVSRLARIATRAPHMYPTTRSSGGGKRFYYPTDQWVQRISLRLFGALVVVPAPGLN